jgi:tRNA threonylcarbamoyladenosine biosynthesis protein TsaE
LLLLLLHPVILETRQQVWPDEDACAAWAAALAARPALACARIELEGHLGAGKTTFVRHLLRALGVSGRIKSPSYAIVEPYQLAQLAVWHFDFYRFSDPREWEEAGFRDILASPGLMLIEWADKARGLLPAPDLRLHLSTQPDGSRALLVEAHSHVGLELLP